MLLDGGSRRRRRWRRRRLEQKTAGWVTCVSKGSSPGASLVKQKMGRFFNAGVAIDN